MTTGLNGLYLWLGSEADARLKEAKSRRDSANSTRGRTSQQLRADKAMAEKMFGRKLDLVSTKVKDNERDCDTQDRIATKLESEASQLRDWQRELKEIG